MIFGISVYSNDEFRLNENLDYIKMASECGINYVFTSMHLPEVDYKLKLAEINKLVKTSKDFGLKVTVDISPVVFSVLGASTHDLSPFYNLGIDCLRLDYGFSDDETAEMSNNRYKIGIELNASTILSKQIVRFINSNADIKNISTCHNFYPRPYTGLSYDFFTEKSSMLKSYSMKVGAFISSSSGRRGPIFEGLPTLEGHRNLKPYYAARQLAYSKMVDYICFGDAYASQQEIRGVTSIDENVLDMSIELAQGVTGDEEGIIFAGIHTNRPDASSYIIRSEESRGYARMGKPIAPHDCRKRVKYSVTIDNTGFKRYSGEMQICMEDLPEDPRVNYVGHIPEQEHILADLIRPETRFRFRKD